MKSSQSYIVLLATATLVLAGTATAQGNLPATGPVNPTGSVATRVTKDSVKNRFTAKDLIGAAVYDRTGDKIGEIADIDLQGAVPGALARSFNADQGNDRAPTTAMPATVGTDASGANPGSKADSTMGHATVLLSVGGLWGVGDDLVSLPMSAFSYNSDKDRFELSASKGEIVALAEGKAHGGYSADAPIASGTRAGKQSFADEAKRVKEALMADPMTSPFAAGVTITTDGENLVIHGLVDNKEQKQRILDTARRATPLKVEDEIDNK